MKANTARKRPRRKNGEGNMGKKLPIFRVGGERSRRMTCKKTALSAIKETAVIPGLIQNGQIGPWWGGMADKQKKGL